MIIFPRLKHDIETKFIEEEKEEYYSPMEKKRMRTKYLIKQFNSAIMRVLAPHCPHLFSAQVCAAFGTVFSIWTIICRYGNIAKVAN